MGAGADLQKKNSFFFELVLDTLVRMSIMDGVNILEHTMKRPETTSRPIVATVWKGLDLAGKRVLDYGCGAFSRARDYVESRGGRWAGYDPHYMPDESALSGRYDMIICANVVNVVHDINDRVAIYRRLHEIQRRTGCSVKIQVYEGNKSGDASNTQMNKSADFYMPEIKYSFSEYPLNRKGNIITVFGGAE